MLIYEYQEGMIFIMAVIAAAVCRSSSSNYAVRCTYHVQTCVLYMVPAGLLRVLLL